MNVTRRFFLKSSAALAATYCGISPGRILADAGLDPNNLLTVRKSKTLVAIFLRGGMDGINFVVPYKDPGYHKLRKGIALADPGQPGSHSERKQDFSPAFVRKALEHSLKRLQTDYIDLYMAHNIKLPQFRDDMFAELEKAQAEGKIRTWGVSLGPAIGWREEGIAAILEHNAKAVQTVYNLFEQSPGREFCETAVSGHAGVLARVHDNSSILKDVVKIDTTIDANDHRKFRDQHWKIYGLKKLELVRHYASDHGMNVHQLACKWLLQQAGLTSITGTFLNETEIADAIESVDKPNLSTAELTQLAHDYANDFGLGVDAHPCDLKSSTDPSGRVRSGYVPSPVLIA